MKKRANRLAVLLAVSLMLSLMPAEAAAAGTVSWKSKNTEQAEKDKKKAEYRITKLKEPKLEKSDFPQGTAIEDMELPKELKGEGYEIAKGNKKSSELKIKKIRWKTDYEETSKAGEYIFQAKLPEKYELDEDVELPELKIKITESKKEAQTESGKAETEESKKPETEKETEEGKKPETEKETEEGKKPETEKKTEEGKKPETEKKTEEGKKPETEKETEEGKKPETEKETEEGKKPETEKKTEEGKKPETEKKTEESKKPAADPGKRNTEDETQKPGDGTGNETDAQTAELKFLSVLCKDAKVTVDEEKQTVQILLQKADADLKKVVLQFEVAEGIVVTPASGTETDFSESAQTPVIYKLVRTSDNLEKEYKVTATICSHDWTPATCTDASVCKNCGAAGETALGHNYAEATCTAPKTCTRCKVTEGKALGHNYAEATCTAPKTCTRCKVTEGKALGHNYTEATCTAPKTCTRCKVTEGKALGHNYTEATCTAPKTCTRCKVTEGKALGHKWSNATCQKRKTCKRCGKKKGKRIGHFMANKKIIKKATHEEKGKKQWTCKWCNAKKVATIPKEILIGLPEDNRISGLNSTYTTGTNITFTAVGACMDNHVPIEGDVRYKPVSWSCGTGSGSLEGDQYSKTILFTNPGDYTLRVTFERQEYEKGKWVTKSSIAYESTDTKTAALKITGSTVTTTGTNGSGKVTGNTAANTSDPNEHMVVLIAVFGVSLVVLIGMAVLSVRRRKIKRMKK